MGMFDELTVKCKLPLSEELEKLNIDWTKIVFQTKDLDSTLSTYVIEENGTLIKNVVQYDYIPFTEEEKKNKNHKPWTLWKEVIELKRETQKVDIHGKLNIYSLVDFPDEQQGWAEFDVYFSYGKLDKIEQLELEKFESFNVRAKKMDELEKIENQKLGRRIKAKLRKFGWVKFWRAVSRILNKTQNGISSLNSFISRKII
jgi:hypothetical protein